MKGHAHIEICPNPIFIIGSPRSGTTILARSLDQHDELWASRESDFMLQLFGGDRAKGVYRRATERPVGSWLRAEKVEQAEFFAYLGAGVNALFTSRSGSRRWIDHSPLYTEMVDDLAEMFPGALFLHMLRDGRRVAQSMVNFLDGRPPERRAALEKAHGPSWWGNNFRKACRTWARYVEKAAGFCARNPDRTLTLVNEELVADPGAGFRKILAFLSVGHEDRPAEFFRSHRINSSFKREGRVTPTTLGEPWREWTPGQRSTFAEEAGPTLIAAGFATEQQLAGWQSDGGQSLARRRGYQLLVHALRDTVTGVTPADAKVLVVSRGDDSLLELEGREAWHFPMDATGAYMGHHPADAPEAIGQLELLRARGADFLVFPTTERWWLEHYEDLRRHLASRYDLVIENEHCVVYGLTGPFDSANAVRGRTHVRSVEICPSPVFVIGAPRSGTTALAMALGRHSQLWTSGESIVLWSLFGGGRIERAYKSAVTRPAWTWFKREQVERSEFLESAALGLNVLFTSRTRGKRWVDQTPIYALMIDSLADMFPEAHFVHILRDGRSVVESMIHFLDVRDEERRRKMFEGGFAPKWVNDFQEACRTWRRYVEKVTDFEQTSQARCLTIRQEHLVKNAQAGFARIFDFLDVPDEEGPVTYFRTHRVNSSFERNWKMPFTVASLSRPWETWSNEQRATFVEEAGETLIRLGLASAEELAIEPRA